MNRLHELLKSMDTSDKLRHPGGWALRTSIAYAVIGALWILFSDQAAAAITNDADILTRISLYKGWAYILVTAIILYVLIHRQTSALQKSQNQLRTFIEQAPLSIAMFDQEMNYLATSRRWHLEFGRGHSELVGKNHYAIHPDIPHRWRTAHKQGLAGEEIKNDDDVWVLSDGTTLYLRWAISPWIDERGQVGGIIISSEDITTRKKIEEQLQLSEERYRSLFENMANGVAHCQMFYKGGQPVDFIFLNVNPAFKTLTGINDFLGKRVSVLIPGIDETNPEILEIFGRVAITGVPERFESFLPALNGGTWFSFSVYSTEKKQFVAVIENISDRKRNEIALQERERKLNTIFELIPVGLSILDQTNQIVLINPALERILDISQEGLFRGDYRKRTYLRTDGTVMQPEEFASTRAQKENHPVYNVEVGVVKEDGQVVWTNINAVPVEFSDWKVIIVTADITQRKHIEQELRETLEHLKQSNAELEQFAYVASHDLQEPLRTITGLIQLIQRKYTGQFNAEVDEDMTLVVNSAIQMQKLIQDLLLYSKMGNRDKILEQTDLQDVISTALFNLATPIQESGAVITYDTFPTILVDPTQMEQVFRNLISNAIKFCGGQPPHIHLGVEPLPDAWCFSVRDNGIGIAPEHFERIFSIFERLHTRDQYPGTGIGLAICKKIVERHGGSIWVDSKSGEGSTFSFTIPHSMP